MPSARQLKNGSWRYEAMIDRRRYSFTSSEKLSDRAIRQRFDAIREEKKKEDPKSPSFQFGYAMGQFMHDMTPMLSASTLRAYQHYERYLNEHYQWFTELPINAIDTAQAQKLISHYASTKDPSNTRKTTSRSAKSVRNFYGFITAVLRKYSSGIELNVTLPKSQKSEKYVPSDSEVTAVVNALRENEKLHKYLIAVMLACHGLRRSEICALTPEDLDGNTLRITKAKVKAPDGRWIVKAMTKTPQSQRDIRIPPELADMIRETGCIFPHDPGDITDTLARLQKKLGIHHFGIHALRHFYASTAIAKGEPLPYIAKFGGWKEGSQVLQKVYIHAMTDKQAEMDKPTLDHIGGILGL